MRFSGNRKCKGDEPSAHVMLKQLRVGAPVQFQSHPKTKAWQFRKEDKAFAAAWCKYHAQHAKLRLLCQACAQAVNRERQEARDAAQHNPAAAAGEL